MKRRNKIILVIIGLLLIYNICTFIKYTIAFPERKVKIDPKIQEIIEIEKNTELVQKKIEQKKRKKEEEERRIAEENYIKAITPTKEEIEQSKNIYKIIDFRQKPDKKAVDIFYDFIIKENKDCVPDCTNEISSKDLYYAYFVDLNDDKINEIIGMVDHTMYRGRAGYSVFILKDANNKYTTFDDSILHRFEHPLKILTHKTNNYHDITISEPKEYQVELTDFVLQYNGKHYITGYILN